MGTNPDDGPEDDLGQEPIQDLIAMLDSVLAALDSAGEGLAAAHVDMARQVLVAKGV